MQWFPNYARRNTSLEGSLESPAVNSLRSSRAPVGNQFPRKAERRFHTQRNGVTWSRSESFPIWPEDIGRHSPNTMEATNTTTVVTRDTRRLSNTLGNKGQLLQVIRHKCTTPPTPSPFPPKGMCRSLRQSACAVSSNSYGKSGRQGHGCCVHIISLRGTKCLSH